LRSRRKCEEKGEELRSKGKRGRSGKGRLVLLKVRRKSIPFLLSRMALP
jgi:hypothetical protein